jgi:hypothetical protein
MSDQEMSKKRKIYCTDDGNTNDDEENTSLEPHKIPEYEQAEMSDLLKYQLLLACLGEAIEKNQNVFRRQENIEYLRMMHSGMEFDYRAYQSGIFILHRDEKITHKTALILRIKIQQKTNDMLQHYKHARVLMQVDDTSEQFWQNHSIFFCTIERVTNQVFENNKEAKVFSPVEYYAAINSVRMRDEDRQACLMKLAYAPKIFENSFEEYIKNDKSVFFYKKSTIKRLVFLNKTK